MVQGYSDSPIKRRNTWQRRAVLEILGKSAAPISADEIFLRLQRQNLLINLSTIYRTLNVQLASRQVHRIFDGDSRQALFTVHGGNCNTHIAVCRSCGREVPVRHCPLEKIPDDAVDGSFRVECHHIELRGVCGSCEKGR